MNVRRIEPCGPLRATVRPPGSKSLTNRALVCAALAEGTSTLRGALDSDDTRVLIAALEKLGLRLDVRDGGTTLEVAGSGGVLQADEPLELFIGNSGTSVRFLTAMLALGRGDFRLDGVPRMRQRPIGDLIDALNALGADVRSENGDGCPPVLIRARGLPGGTATVRGDISSQYLSGLLMAAPLAAKPVRLEIEGDLVSKPYVAMTLRVMSAFGVDVAGDATAGFEPPQATYRACAYDIEPDASAASYFFAAAAIAGGEVTVRGLSRHSLQGDVAFADVLQRMGCRVAFGEDSIRLQSGTLTGVDVDMNAISDTVQTLAAVALFAQGPTMVRGVAHNRHKETDRIADLARELRKFGAEVEERPDGLRIVPPEKLQAATVDTYDDHRMAMSLSLVGLRIPGVEIRDPECVAKTYPRFFDDLAALRSASET